MKTNYIEPETVERLRECMSDGDWLVLRVALETGMRIGDIVALRGENITENKIVFTAQKTGKKAEIFINQQLFRDISAKKRKNPKKWIFPSP